MIPNMLLCTKCKIDKDEGEFPRNNAAKSRAGLGYWCRDCCHAHYKSNEERHKRQTRTNSIRYRYNLTVEEYDALIAKGCGICGEKARTRIVLDHCHARDKVREALCNNCNVLLGAAHDDPEILEAAASYVRRHAST